MLSLENLTIQAGQFVLSGVNLRVAPGEYFVLMGATGSGKSLLVKAISGLLEVERGRILLNDQDVTRLPPRQRKVGYVPQESALFPHLSVRGNLLFAPRLAGMSRRQGRDLVDPIVKALGLEPLLRRSTLNLSGGERQKVALGRALAAHPDLLILDEPVSALDEPTRREICLELRRAHKAFGATTIHVCHSLSEAALVADRVGILGAGRLLQVGRLEELRLQPAGPEVARLLQIDKSDLL